jgi:hypothetical protein
MQSTTAASHAISYKIFSVGYLLFSLLEVAWSAGFRRFRQPPALVSLCLEGFANCTPAQENND